MLHESDNQNILSGYKAEEAHTFSAPNCPKEPLLCLPCLSVLFFLITSFEIIRKSRLSTNSACQIHPSQKEFFLQICCKSLSGLRVLKAELKSTKRIVFEQKEQSPTQDMTKKTGGFSGIDQEPKNVKRSVIKLFCNFIVVKAHYYQRKQIHTHTFFLN